MRNPDVVYVLKMEYVSKINIFGLNMIIKRGAQRPKRCTAYSTLFSDLHIGVQSKGAKSTYMHTSPHLHHF